MPRLGDPHLCHLCDLWFNLCSSGNEPVPYAALRQSEALRQTILQQKAFTGRLVPQSPADEPASTLLARLRAGRETSAGQSGRRIRATTL